MTIPRKLRLWHLARMEQKPIFNETWISDATCVGHNEDDVQPFHDLFLEEQVSDREGEASSEVPAMKKYYTNGELYGLLHPAKMNLPYVYDNFEWPHCDVSDSPTLFSGCSVLGAHFAFFLFHYFPFFFWFSCVFAFEIYVIKCAAGVRFLVNAGRMLACMHACRTA